MMGQTGLGTTPAFEGREGRRGTASDLATTLSAQPRPPPPPDGGPESEQGRSLPTKRVELDPWVAEWLKSQFGIGLTSSTENCPDDCQIISCDHQPGMCGEI
jgi:hypothetical protein